MYQTVINTPRSYVRYNLALFNFFFSNDSWAYIEHILLPNNIANLPPTHIKIIKFIDCLYKITIDLEAYYLVYLLYLKTVCYLYD